MKFALFGPAGATGRHVLQQALEAGHSVRGIERDFPNGFPDHERFEKVTADTLEDDLRPLVEGCDAVVSALGLGRDPQTLADPHPLYTGGAANIVNAMRPAGVKRLVVISAAFASPDANAPLWFRAATLPLVAIFRQMAAMEYVLEAADGIDWTAVRPGWLLNREHTGDYQVAKDSLPKGTLRTRRADLADFLLRCASSEEWVGQRPFVARREALHLETPPALVEEILPI